jgi:putative transposase
MIQSTVDELTAVVGTRPACRALGAAPATIYRARNPPAARPSRPRQPPDRALSDAEREAVLAELHSERFQDSSPAQVWATLLDEGRYLASERTMYRLLDARHGGVRERRAQLEHPPYAAPELLAERPNQVHCWDITKLKGPAKWTYYYLYVVRDVFSRYAVGWTVQHRENSQVAKDLIAQVCDQQNIARDQLTVHADRGSSMTSKPVAFLLADLGVVRSHNRPYTSTDNPYSEQRLHLALLIHRQHDRHLGRVQIQADDVVDLVHEQRVVGELERVRAVRLEIKRPPDPPDRRRRQPRPLGHLRARPVRRVLRCGLQGRHDDVLDLFHADRRRPARPRVIHEPIQPQLAKPTTPLADRRLRDPARRSHVLIGAPLRTGQHDPRAQRQRLRGLAPPRPAHQLITLLVSQHKLDLRASSPGHATVY